MDRFPFALSVVLRFEGGYVDNPADRGGATNRGITQRTYTAWLKRQGRPDASVRDIPTADVGAIYRVDYWDAVSAAELPMGLDLIVFDLAVNSGPKTAGKMLQRALGMTGADVDGVIGPKTLQAVRTADAGAVARGVLELRDAFYRNLSGHPGQAQFLRGWLRRLDALRAML